MPEPTEDYREVEAKFGAEAAAYAALLDLQEIAGFKVVDRSVGRQQDVYFDTADGQLGRVDASLRVRRLSGGALMTFKGDPQHMHADDDLHFASRVEDETLISPEDTAQVSIDHPLPDTIDASPLRRARELVPSGRLVPIAVIENERTVLHLSDDSGATIEMAVDRAQGTRLSDGRVIDFDEVELETKSADHDTLARVARALQQSVAGLRPNRDTKLGRTLG
jgi:inorganic triphosphatase YgiF